MVPIRLFHTRQQSETHRNSLTSELKIKLFFFFIIRGIIRIFIAVKNRYLNLSAVLRFATTQNKPKRVETKPQAASTTNDSRPIFHYYAHNQTDFENLFINGRGFIYLGISKMSFTFSVFRRVQGSVLIKAARKTNIWLYAHCR